jgi:hypothetical protein
MTKITQRALFFAVLIFTFSCHSGPNESISHADANRLLTGKYDFSHDPDLISVRVHAEEAQVQETRQAASNLLRLLNLIGDTATAALNSNSPYQESASDANALTKLVHAKVALAYSLHALNQLKKRFASDLGVGIVGDYTNNLLSYDSTANIAIQQTYADIAIVKELQFGNAIDGLTTPALAHRLQRPRIPPPPIPKILRRLFGR